MLLPLLTLTALAELPLPVQPDCGEPYQPELCPDDLDERWWMISYIPEHATESIREAERDLGSGISVDRAWRTSTGRWDAIVAVGDSGLYWDESDMVNKIHVNTGELPMPQDSKGDTRGTYDLDGNGLVNVADWAEDPRVDITAGREHADHLLDPSDLIYTFSDGLDDDANGYTDDIAGWDFFGRDNDPYNDYEHEYGTHGNGVMRTAAGEGGNGGRIGVCPNCAVLPIRLGDTFVDDGFRVAEGVIFAADHGAASMSMALGALSNPQGMIDAAEYAFENGLVLVGATGDENAYHHNMPAALNDVLFVHSISHDTNDDDSDVYSYFNTWNCNNYGPRVDLVSPENACATGAVAGIAGLAALVQSAANDAGITLHAGEIHQLLFTTVDDIWLSDEEREISNAYPSSEGWDPFYGYGRVHAARAVEAAAAGEIPPWISLTGPEWFEPVLADGGGEVEITGIISGERVDSFSYVVEMGRGHDPRSWTTLAEADGAGVMDGVLATFDPDDLAAVSVGEPDEDEGIVGRLERVMGPTVTVRVRVTDSEGRSADRRKTFTVHHDEDLKPGFPVRLGASGEASAATADLDGDGIYEIILSLSDGRVAAYDGAGQPVDGWPATSETIEDLHTDSAGWSAIGEMPDGFVSAPAVGDLDGDGEPEVVAVTFFGDIYAWHGDGTLADGFPYHNIGREPEEFDNDHTYDQGFMAAPTLADIDGDGGHEIIVPGLDSRLYVVGAGGVDFGPYPKEICHPDVCGSEGRRIIDSASVGDLDGDGDLEIAFGTNEATDGGRYSVTYLLDAATGEDEPGWPFLEAGLINEAVLLPLLGEGHPTSPALADIDGDGDLEMMNPIMLGTTDLLNHDTTVFAEVPYHEESFGDDTNIDPAMMPAILQFVSQPSFGDLDGDGTPDLVMGGGGVQYLVSLAMRDHVDYQQPVGAWSGVPVDDEGTETAAFLPAWPRQIEDAQFLTAPIVADISGDGRPEVIMGSGGHVVHAWDADGASPEGWPKLTSHWVLASVSVADIDGDGYLDVVVPTREGWLFAWSTQGRADQVIPWASAFHDPQNTGNHETPVLTQEGPPPVDTADTGSTPVVVEDEEEQGCCKKNKSDKGSGAAGLILLGLLSGLRRRERPGEQEPGGEGTCTSSID